MKKITKSLTALLLALMMIFGAVSVPAMAYNPNADLYVNDIMKSDCDPYTLTCRTLLVFFRNQFKHYNSSTRIDILGENGGSVAYCVPRSGDINAFDLYDATTNAFGVTLKAEREYTLVIPEGAFYTDENLLCNEYKTVFTGVFLTGANTRYTIKDLGMQTFFPTSYTDNVLYKGKLYFNSDFNRYDSDNCTVTLKIIGSKDGKTTYTTVAETTVLSLDNSGCAELNFGTAGVTIDKYAEYRFVVSYASFYNMNMTLCDESVYDLSGKKLIKLREDYPFIDILVDLFGKDNTVIDILLTVLEYTAKVTDFLNNNDFGSKLNFLGIPDITDYYEDVKAYIKAK